MLPQIKRPGRDDGEVEIEVVAVKNVDGSELSDDDPTVMASNTLFPKESRRGTSDLARRGEKPVFTDEPTRLMPSKHGARSPGVQSHAVPVAPPSVRPPPSRAQSASVRPPPASMRPSSNLPDARMPNRMPSVIPPPASASSFPVAPTSMEFRPMPNTSLASRPSDAPPPFRDREESQTNFRPISELAEGMPHDVKQALAVPSAGAIKAQVEAARAKRHADQRHAEKRSRAAETLEVTPVSISERFVVKGRPAFPWAVACVAMGIVAGLAVAFTGGRASAIAAFIDPSHEAAPVVAAAANAQATTQAVAPVANDPAASLLAGAQAAAQSADANPALPTDLTATTPNVFAVGRAASAPPATAAAPAEKTAEKKVAAATHSTPHVDKPAAQPKAEPKPEKTADNSAAPKSESGSSASHHSSSKSSKHSSGSSGGGDVDSAAAADALAKAQLENSL